MSDLPSEFDLALEAAKGDGAALERLLLRHYDRLVARLRSRIPAARRRVISAEDVLQQTFQNVFVSVGTFVPEEERSFGGWLTTVADRCLQDALKAQDAIKRGGDRAIVERDDPDLVALVEVLAGPRHTPSRSVAGHEAARLVRAALAALPPDYRDALELRYVQRLPVVDAAETMGRTPRAIHNLCRRGLAAMRASLGGIREVLFTRVIASAPRVFVVL